jgi:hypothetical protein
MGRRRTAGRDTRIVQGHRRDQFFARMRRRGGVARLPNQAPDRAIAEPEPGVREEGLESEGVVAEDQVGREPGAEAQEIARPQE